MKGSRRELTHGERILLHASMFHHDKGSFEAPYALCQDGMSEILGILKNNVSREIGRLKEEGLIEEELARVKGAERRRNIYQLTAKGEKVCEEIKKELCGNVINLMEDGEVKRISVKDAVERLKKIVPDTDPFHVTEWMRTRDVLDPRDFTPYHRVAGEGKKRVELMAGAPLVKSFYGRKEDIEKIVGSLSGEDVPMVIITGIPGIGKSTLAARVTDELRGKKSLFWHTFQPWDTRERLLGDLKEFHKMASGAHPRGKDTYEVLNEVLNSVPDPVLVFDNCEKASGDLTQVFGILRDMKKRKGGFGVLLMSREKLSFYDVRDVMNRDVVEHELGPLDQEDVAGMMDGTEFPREVYLMTKGHPLYVEIYKRFGGKTESMDEFIEREMYLALHESERGLMKKLAVLLDPCQREMILDKGEEEMLLKLKSSHLVEETRDGKLSVHSLLKDLIYARLSPVERQELHARTGRAMMKKKRTPDLETLYHLEKGGCWKEALDILSMQIYAVGHLHEEHRRELLELFPDELVPREHMAEYHELKGDIHMEAGEWREAVESYERALNQGHHDREAVMEKMGEAQRNLRRWKDALETHKKTLEAYRDSGDREGEVRELLALGTVYRKKGDLQRADKHYQMARDIIEKEDIPDAQGPLLNNMGLLHMHNGDLTSAEKHFKRALEHGTSGITYENMAELYRRIGSHGDVLDVLERAVETYSHQAKWRDVSRSCLALGKAYGSAGKPGKAAETFRKGLRNEEIHRKKGLFRGKSGLSQLEIELHRNLADALREHDWEGCLEHRKMVLEALRTMEDREGEMRARLEYAFDMRDSGDTGGALNELRALEKEMEDQERGLIACKLEMVRICRDTGLFKDALEVAREVLKMSRDAGEDAGVSVAKELMDEIRVAMKRGSTSG